MQQASTALSLITDHSRLISDIKSF